MAYSIAARTFVLVVLSRALVLDAVKAVSSPKEFSDLLASSNGRPIIVEFASPTSRGLPIFQKLAKDKEFLGRAFFRKVDVAASPELAKARGVETAPAYQFWLHGEKYAQLLSGEASEDSLWSWTRRLVEKADTDAGIAVSMISSPSEFADQLEQAGDLPLIVEFVSPACMTCLQLAPVFKRLAVEFAGRALFRKVDSKTPGGAETALARGAQEMPTFQFWLRGKKHHSEKGLAATEAGIKEWTQRIVNMAASSVERSEPRPKPSKPADPYDARPCFPRPRLRGSRPCKAPEVEESVNTADILLDSLATGSQENWCSKTRTSKPGITEKVIIVGGGPAGMSAAIYAARANLCPLVIAPAVGGQLMSKGVDVENYPGMPRENGGNIISVMKKQAQSFSTEVRDDNVLRINASSRPLEVWTEHAGLIKAQTVIFATGANSRWLHADGEDDFKGHGVSACAACDGFLYRGKKCAVIGGGDSALEEALMLSRICSSVTIVHRRDKFRASAVLQKSVLGNAKVVVKWNSEVLRFEGKVEMVQQEEMRSLTHLLLKNTLAPNEAPEKLIVDAAFVAVGHDPNTRLLAGQVDMDAQGYVVTPTRSTQSSVETLFVAGDVADHVYRQAITSAGSGAMAALDAQRWLSEHATPEEDPWEDNEHEERHFEI